MVGGAALLRALTDSGMAHVLPHTPADRAWLRPASPDLALLGVLAGRQSRLARDQQLLLDGQRRLAHAQARYGLRMTGAVPEHLVVTAATTIRNDRSVLAFDVWQDRFRGQHDAVCVVPAGNDNSTRGTSPLSLRT